MWAIIKTIIGIAVALMAFSMLLGSFLLPTAVVLVPQQALAQESSPNPSQDSSQDPSPNPSQNRAQSMFPVVEEDVAVPIQPQPAQDYKMPASERLVVPTDDKTFDKLAAQDLMAELSEQDAQSLGVLRQSDSVFGDGGFGDGGFGADVWQGLSRDRAVMLLERIRENGLKSPTAQALVERLLLTQADPPKGPSNTHWLATRVRTLQDMGMVQDAHRLLNRLPEKPKGKDDLLRVWVNDQLLIGQTKGACSQIKESLMNSDAPYWQHAMMVCQALRGNLEKLRLSVRTAEDEEKFSQRLLFGLFDSIMNTQDSPRLAPEDVFTPLHVALYQAYPRLINPDVMRRLPDVTLRRILKTPDLDMSLRLQAAEKLVNDFAETEDAQRLTDLYASVEFSSDMVASPLKYVRNEVDGSRARALLWQGAKTADLASGKALALKTLWERAEADQLAGLPGYLSPDLLNIKPQSNLAWFSPYVIKMALRRGHLSMAQKWWDVLSDNRSLSRDLTVERTDIAISFAMLDGQMPEGLLDQWWSTQTLHNLESRLKTTRVLAMLEALNMTVPSDMWVSIHHEFNDAHVDTPPGPGPIWLRLVGSSLERGHTAEAILMLVEPFMYAHATKLPPQGIANIVAGLNYLGLISDAKELALEAVIKGEKTPN